MRDYTLEEKEAFMREALKEAEIALAHEEIPIGCVIVKDGEIIGRGHNAREELQRAVMHAEVIRRAVRGQFKIGLGRIGDGQHADRKSVV